MSVWTTLTRGDRDFERDIDKRSVAGARRFLEGPYALHKRLGTLIQLKDRPYYTERVDGIIGRPQEIAEGTQEAPPMMPIDVADMKLRVKLFAGALVLSKERVDDEGAPLIQKLAPKMTERGLEAIEISFQQMLLLNPTVYNPQRDLRDGVAWASTAHPVGPYGDTWGNTFATPTVLSETALATVVSSFMSVRDDNGDLAPLMPTRFLLCVHPSMLQQARQLVMSMSSTADYKNSGVRNLTNVGDITWEVLPLLYSQNTNAWFVVALDGEDDSSTGLTIVARQLPTAPRKIIRENPDQVQYLSKARWGMGITDPRHIFWSGHL